MCPSGRNASPITAANPDLRQAFEVIDADGDGKISREDLRAFYGRSSCSCSEDERMIGTMIAVADANRDGFVELDEFQKVLETGPSSQVGLMRDVFDAMDTDGDGRLSHADLKAYLDSAALPSSPDDIQAMLTFAGGDSDRGVSFDGWLRIFGF